MNSRLDKQVVKMSDLESDEQLQSGEGGSTPQESELKLKEEAATPEPAEYPGLGTKVLVTFALSIALLMV